MEKGPSVISGVTSHRKTPSTTAAALIIACLAIAACLAAALPDSAHAAENGASTTVYVKYYKSKTAKVEVDGKRVAAYTRSCSRRTTPTAAPSTASSSRARAER